MSLAARCGPGTAARDRAVAELADRIRAERIERVRFGWCDLHGVLRSKTLVADAAIAALDAGVGLVSSILLKDASDRTTARIFEPGGARDLPGFAFAGNLVLMADPDSFRTLPWTAGTGWLRTRAYHPDGTAVPFDTRAVLLQALERLAAAGYGLDCGLEVEFHVYRIEDDGPQRDPALAAWPGPAPRVSLIHPGYCLLGDAWYDLAEAPLEIVRRTAQDLGLPLASLEVELGPSQVEAVFGVTDALTAADNMVLFRNGVRQALRRAGYHATFMCRPPFPNIMSSGWHLHQSLVDRRTGSNAFVREQPPEGVAADEAQQILSPVGEHYLAGLLAHARGMSPFCTPTTNGYGRFQPNTLAPQSIVWGRDNRGAMLRVIGRRGDSGTRIENRIGEPAANPYLYLAAQIHAGLDGIEQGLRAGPETTSPYATDNPMLPTSLGEAVDALCADEALCRGFGTDFVRYYERIKRADAQRFAAAEDKLEFFRREYFSRI